MLVICSWSFDPSFEPVYYTVYSLIKGHPGIGPGTPGATFYAKFTAFCQMPDGVREGQNSLRTTAVQLFSSAFLRPAYRMPRTSYDLPEMIKVVG